MKNSAFILYIALLTTLIFGCNRFTATEESVLESARSHYNKGVALQENGNIIDACNEFFLSKEIMENHLDANSSTDDDVRFLALTYTNIAEIFNSYGMGHASLYAYKNALSYMKKVDDYDLSDIYRFIGNSYYLENEKDSALYYYRKAIKISKQRDNTLIYNKSISEAASLYYDMGYVDTAFMLIQEAMFLPEDDDMYLARCLTIGALLMNETQYDKAVFYLEKSLGRDFFPTQVVAAEYLMKCYEILGDTFKTEYYKTLYGNHFTQYREESEIVTELTKIYESYKQKDTIKEQDKIQRKQNRYVVIISVLIFVFIIAVIVFRKMMNNKRNDIAKMKRKMETNPFITEPICKSILDVVHANQFKSKVGFEIYKEFALDKNQLLMLRDAVDRHHDNLTHKLTRRFPELKSDDIDYCCLYLLGLKDADVSALMQRAYPTVCERSRKLKRIFNSKEPLQIIINNIIETINQ